MSKKQLISSALVRAAAKCGERVLYLRDKTTIVTAEATSTAKELGIALQLGEPSAQPPAVPEQPDASDAAIRRALAAHTGGEIREDLLAEVMRRVALERASPGAATVRKIASLAIGGPVDGGGAVTSKLDLATLVAGETVPRAAGFMAWSNNFVSFKRKHDEVQVVLEGELRFRIGKDTVAAGVGDVMLIPKDVQLEIGTASSVRLFYVSYNG